MKNSNLYKFNSNLRLTVFSVILLLVLITLSSCHTPYQKPDVPMPSEYRGSQPVAPQPAAQPSKPAFGEIYWGDLIKDDVLKDLINTALVNNYDLNLAVEKILEAGARFGIARADLYPTINGEALNQSQQLSRNSPVPLAPGYPQIQHYTQLDLNLYFELDLWGRLRRTADAAKADLLATENAKNTVLVAVISEVASSYLQLREFDFELEISKKTLESRLASYKLVKAREEWGKATMLDVDQSSTLVIYAQAAITNIQREIEQQENYISFLLGKNPGSVPRGKSFSEQIEASPLPPGVPSALLENRPDIRQAEQSIIAAGARIDAARAVFFPQITLTGADGTLSSDFSNLLKNPSAIWLVTPKLTLPIFNAGKISSNVKVTESQQRQAVIQYTKTVQNAFREVSDSLTGYDKQRVYAQQQKELVDTLTDQLRLSNMRYIGGVTSYLEVLDSDRQCYEAQINYAEARLGELLYIIKLYKALGGGWKK